MTHSDGSTKFTCRFKQNFHTW